MAADPGNLLATIRASEPDRYLATLWLPYHLRAPVASVYACAAEISAIPGKVREPVAGEIRLQWWREVLEGAREHAGHPIAAAVLETVRHHRLPRRALADFASARIFDLYHDPMPDRAALEAWCGETDSALFQLVALIAGAEPHRTLADACGHAGCAYAYAREARLAGWRRSQAKCFIPADLLEATGLTPGEFLDEPWGERHAAALEAFAAAGRDHLHRALDAVRGLDRSLRPVFLPLATVSAQFDLALRAGPALFEQAPELSGLRRHWLVARMALGGGPA